MEITSLQQVGTTVPQAGNSKQVGAAPATPPADKAAAPQEAGAHELHEAAKMANSAMDALSLSLNFSLDSDLGKVVVKVVDSATNQVIKQIPSQEMLDIARALDKLQGLLVKAKA